MIRKFALLQKLHPRHLRWWQWLALVVLGIILVLRSWLPELLRQQIVTQLSSLTPAQVKLGDVDINLLRGRSTLQKLEFTLDGETQPVLAIANLALNVSVRALLRREIHIEDIHFSGVEIHAVQEANGQFNLSRLLSSTPTEHESAPADLPTLTLQRLRFTDSQFIFYDRMRSPELRLPFAINKLMATDVSLQASGLAAPVPVKLDCTLDKSLLQGEAQVFWQREQTKIDAKVEAKQIALAMIEPYLREVLTVQNLSGWLEANLQYGYDSARSPLRSLLTGVVNVSHLQFVDEHSTQTVFVLPEGRISIYLPDFPARNLHVQSIELKDPKLVLLQSDTGLNLTSWVRTAQGEPGTAAQGHSSPAWNFSIPLIKWTGGELVYRDNAWPEKEKLTLRPEEIIVRDLKNGMTELPFQFRTRIGDGKVAGEGLLWFAIQQLEFRESLALRADDSSDFTQGKPYLIGRDLAGYPPSEGLVWGKLWPFVKLQVALQAEDLDVAILQPLLTPVLVAKQVQGKVTGELKTVLFERGNSHFVRVYGTVETKKFSVSDTPEQSQTLAWEEGKIVIPEGSSLMPFSLYLEPNLSQVVLQRKEQGDLTIERMTGNVRLTSLTSEGGQESVSLVGPLETTKFSLSGLPEAANVLTWESGHLEFQEGSLLTPLALKLKTQLSQLALRHLPQGDVTIEKVNSELQLMQGVSAQESAMLKAHGPIEFANFALTRGEEKQILLGCYQGKATVSEGSRAIPLDLKLGDVTLEYPYAQGMRPPSGQFQLFIPSENKPEVQTLATASVSEDATAPVDTTASAVTQHPQPPAPTAVSSPTVSIQIDRATMIGGQLYFEDRTVTPPQTVYWQDVRVELNHAGYPLLLPATFSARAYNEDGAPIEFKGATERKGGRAVVRIHGKVEKMSLSRFNSYLEPSLGYRVKKGAVTASWDLVIPGDRLQANMKVALHDIGLSGRPRSSTLEEQVGLPLTLVIALLKDLNGDINLQLPVAGRMGDPGVQWSGTVLRAMRDVLIGAVTSPLKVLGALFQGKDKLEGFTLEPIRFVAGTNQLATDGQEQLSRLAVFLSQRPKIDLRLSGMVGGEDLEMLRIQEMLKQLPEEPPAQEKAQSPPQVTPQADVRRWLIEKRAGQEGTPLSLLSPQANELLSQLQKQTQISAASIEQLGTGRVQAVINELTSRHAIAADRLQVSPEKQRGAGSAEVRYTIQTREEKESSQ